MAQSRWDNRAILQIPKSEKKPNMHYRFVRKNNVKNLKAQGYIKCDKKNGLSEPTRNEMVIMMIPKKDAEEKKAYFRGLHQEKYQADKETQKEMANTVMTPEGKRPVQERRVR